MGVAEGIRVDAVHEVAVSIDAKQDLPIDLAARREDESGRITMKILGKYEASIKVGELLL